MSDFTSHPDFIIRRRDEVQQIVGATHALAIQKVQTRLGRHAKELIRRSPFVCIGSQGVASGADVSPRGDPPGFVQILDDRTLAIPDRPGNNRVDTLLNILENDRIGLLFIIPGFDDTLRVNGRAILTNEPQLMADMAVNGRSPGLAIVVKVDEVFVHCAKAFRRSHLWSPDHLQKRSEMPSLVKIVSDETTEEVVTAEEQRERDEALEHAYRNTLYQAPKSSGTSKEIKGLIDTSACSRSHAEASMTPFGKRVGSRRRTPGVLRPERPSGGVGWGVSVGGAGTRCRGMTPRHRVGTYSLRASRGT